VEIMETLANLESFVRSAELGGFSAAARRLSLTPAAVSRNVAMLERNLGIRLFQRSTRKLVLTEAGEHFLQAIQPSLEELQASIANAATDRGEPAGVLRVSLSLTFGVDYIVSLLPDFLKRYPKIRPDWQFESRQVDLIAEGFDAAIGGGIELPPGLVLRVLAPLHIIAVASPDYMKGRTPPPIPLALRHLTASSCVHRARGELANGKCETHRAKRCRRRSSQASRSTTRRRCAGPRCSDWV
jgi:DNA-binding transcriptional LysR family regulator